MKPFAILFAALGIGCSMPEPSRVQPVRVGVHGEAELDACLGVGEITARVDARLAPHASALATTSLLAGQTVHLCGSSEDGEWESVVVFASGGPDCGVSQPVSAPQVYAGPCRSGWVPRNHIRVLAG